MSIHPATIFVADDNTLLLQGLERALRTQGYTVHTAPNGSALLQMLESAPHPPDLLLLDVMMPGADGLEVLQTVQGDSRWSDLPVILITASGDEFLPVSALQQGAVDFLPKPFRLGELLARIEAHIARSRELSGSRSEARRQLRAAEVVRALESVASPGDMLRLVTGCLATLWQGSRCSVVLCHGNDGGQIFVSSETQESEPQELKLKDHPGIRLGIQTGTPLLIEDVATSPLLDNLRAEWEQQNLPPPFASLVIVPLCMVEAACAAVVLCSPPGGPRLNQETLAMARQIVDGMLHMLGRRLIRDFLCRPPSLAALSPAGS